MGLLPPLDIPRQRALPQPSRRRPVQPENLFRNPFAQPACASRPQPAAKPRPFPLSPLYSAPKGRCLNPHAEGMYHLGTFPQPFYTTRLRQQATTCGEAAPLSPFPFPLYIQRPKGASFPFEPFEPARHRRAEPSAPGRLCRPNKKAPSFKDAFH